MKPTSCWFLYLIECRDGSLYAGIATDVERRYAEHAAGSGARYTRSHPPSRLLGWCPYPDRSQASRAEYHLKQLTPARKRELCASWQIAAQNKTHNSCNTPQIDTTQTSERR